MNAVSATWDAIRHAIREERGRSRSLVRAEETDFLPAALELVERPVSPTARWTARVLLAALALICLWLVFGRVDVVATASGRLIPADHVKLIQAPQGGVVRGIHVRDGQRVEAGQLLVELDPTVPAAELAQAGQALKAAELDAARARAILSALDGRGFSFAPPPGATAADIAVHAGLARSQLAEIQAQTASTRSAHDAALAARDQALIEAARLEESLPLLDQQIDANETLLARGHVSRLRVLEMRRQRLSAARERDMANEAARRARAELAAAASSGAQTRAQARARVMSELGTAESEAAVRRQMLAVATERSRLQRIVAPVAGTVAQLAVHTVGGVVEPAASIMVVVPDTSPIVLEARVLNRDVGFINVGQPVAVKLEAFPFTRFGTVPGRIESISSDAVEDERLGLVYVTRIRLERSAIDRGDAVVRLVPGMTASADIRTGERTLLSYLVSPLDEARLEAARER